MIQALKAIFVISLLGGLTWGVVATRPQLNPAGVSKQPLVTQIKYYDADAGTSVDTASMTLTSIKPLTFTPAYTSYLPIIVRNCPVQFTDNFSNPGSGWPVQNTGNVLYEYLNDEYRILVKNANSWFVAGPGVKPANFTVAVEVRNATGIDGSYGLVFGGSDNVSQFYTFEIFPDGVYEIWRYNSGWTLLTGGSSASINPGTATNRLAIERNGSLITAYANGQLLTSLTDGTFTGPRHVGLIVSSYNQPNVDARFDNFTVCGSLTANTLGSVGETLTVDGEGTEATLSGYVAGGSNR